MLWIGIGYWCKKKTMKIFHESPRIQDNLADTRTQISVYSNKVWRRSNGFRALQDLRLSMKNSNFYSQSPIKSERSKLVSPLPSSCSSIVYGCEKFMEISYGSPTIEDGFCPFRGLSFLVKNSNFYLRSVAWSRRSKLGLPLILASNLPVISLEASRFLVVLEDIVDRILLNLHNVEKSLQSLRCKETIGRKIYVMIFERGPLDVIDRDIVQLVCGCMMEEESQHKRCFAADLHYLQRCLAIFLAQVYEEVDKFEQDLIKDPMKSLSSLVVSIDGIFTKFEASIVNSKSMYLSVPVEWVSSCSLLFDKLNGVNIEGSQWMDLGHAINLFYQNLYMLDTYVSKACKPSRSYWFRNTCRGFGLAACAGWFLQHNRLIRSLNIHNFIHVARTTMVALWESLLHPMIFSIGEAFYAERTRDENVEKLVDFYNRFHGDDEALMRALQNFPGGEFACEYLREVESFDRIFVMVLIVLEEVFAAFKITLAVVTALSAFYLSRGFVKMIKEFKQYKKGCDRVTRLQERQLAFAVEREVMNYQNCVDLGRDEDAQFTFGLILYNVDRLYRTLEKHEKATGEWPSIKQDVIDLGNRRLPTERKLEIISHIELLNCLLPSLVG